MLAALVWGGAGAVQAQERTHVLQDGRTLTLAGETVPCGVSTPVDDTRFAIAASFECRDAISGVTGQSVVLIGRQAGEKTPREYLASVGAVYWPDMDAALRDAQIMTARAEFSGDEAELLCVAGGDQEGTVGEATCVLSQPRTQVVIHVRSSGGMEEAYGVLTMTLTGMSIR